MAINDQIRDEKLQYDINREVAKISTWSSGKIHKYEYITGEEILQANQQQIIKQAKFTYPLLEKAFEKQIKTIEDQGQKQIKALQDQGQVKKIKKYTYDDEDTPLISKRKEIFNERADERLEKITELDKKVNYDDLIYKYKGKPADVKFSQFDNAFSLLDKIIDDKISLTNAKNNQENFRLDLNEVKKGKKNVDQKRKKTLCTILMFYKARNNRIWSKT